MTDQELFNRLFRNKRDQLGMFDDTQSSPEWSLETLQNIYLSCNYNYFEFNKEKKYFEHSPYFTPQFKKEGKQVFISAQNCFKLLEHTKIEKSYAHEIYPTQLSKFSCSYLLEKGNTNLSTNSYPTTPEFINIIRQYTFSQIYFLFPNEQYDKIKQYTNTVLSISLDPIIKHYNKQLSSLIYRARNTEYDYAQVYSTINTCMFGPSTTKSPESKDMDTNLLLIKINILQEILNYFKSNPNNLSVPQLQLTASLKINEIYKKKNTSTNKIQKHILSEQQQEKQHLLEEIIKDKLKSYQH